MVDTAHTARALAAALSESAIDGAVIVKSGGRLDLSAALSHYMRQFGGDGRRVVTIPAVSFSGSTAATGFLEYAGGRYYFTRDSLTGAYSVEFHRAA